MFWYWQTHTHMWRKIGGEQHFCYKSWVSHWALTNASSNTYLPGVDIQHQVNNHNSAPEQGESYETLGHQNSFNSNMQRVMRLLELTILLLWPCHWKTSFSSSVVLSQEYWSPGDIFRPLMFTYKCHSMTLADTQYLSWENFHNRCLNIGVWRTYGQPILQGQMAREERGEPISIPELETVWKACWRFAEIMGKVVPFQIHSTAAIGPSDEEGQHPFQRTGWYWKEDLTEISHVE